MMTGRWLEGKVLARDNYNDKFIGQLADLMASVHGIVGLSVRTPKMQGIVDGLEQCDNFTKQAVTEYCEIKSELQYTAYLHGDVWAENVIVVITG